MNLYPTNYNNDVIITKKTIRIVNNEILIIVCYESNRTINLYIGESKLWYLHCELLKINNEVQSIGYLIKVDYTVLDKDIAIEKIISLLLQYINDKYPNTKELYFYDTSTQQCDNDLDVNLAVMTYLYSNKTWYQNKFDAYLSQQNEREFNRIAEIYNNSKDIPWEEMRKTIINNIDSQFSDIELENLYNSTNTWSSFFGTIHNNIGTTKFCIFVSEWIDSFTRKYFNNLRGLIFIIPIKDYKIKYTETDCKS